MVSQDGIVYEKDFGPRTLDEFRKMEQFNPDRSWRPVEEETEEMKYVVQGVMIGGFALGALQVPGRSES
jgi:hypothetical protein